MIEAAGGRRSVRHLPRATAPAAALACLSMLVGCAGSAADRAAPPLPAAAATAGPDARPGEPFEFRRIVMGAPSRLVLYARDPDEADAAASAAFARLGEIEEALSDWMPASEVRQLPTTAGARAHCGPDLAFALSESLRFNRESEGAFDPTLGALTKCWRAARRAGGVPAPEAIAACRARCGAAHVRFDAATATYSADVDCLELDFGGIGQGIGADAALAVIRAHGVPRALVDLSGDIAVGDPPPGHDGWRIELDDPWHTVLHLANGGLTTSGDRFQHLDAAAPGGGTARLSHIIDPATGQPLTTRTEVVAIAPTCIEADAWATALSVAGPERGSALLRRFPRISARWHMETAGDPVRTSDRWPAPATPGRPATPATPAPR